LPTITEDQATGVAWVDESAKKKRRQKRAASPRPLFFRLYDYDDLSDRLDLLAVLYHDSGQLNNDENNRGCPGWPCWCRWTHYLAAWAAAPEEFRRAVETGVLPEAEAE
jgi:hypothetical protein